MDMLHGAIGGKLLRFSLPIAFTGVAEQLFNSADVLLLGQFVGKDAMAAVGNDIPAISLLVLLLLGLSTGPMWFWRSISADGTKSGRRKRRIRRF